MQLYSKHGYGAINWSLGRVPARPIQMNQPAFPQHSSSSLLGIALALSKHEHAHDEMGHTLTGVSKECEALKQYLNVIHGQFIGRFGEVEGLVTSYNHSRIELYELFNRTSLLKTDADELHGAPWIQNSRAKEEVTQLNKEVTERT